VLKLALILSDIRSCHNVGSILRTADGFGIEHIYFAGITPYPKLVNDKRLPHLALKQTAAIHKTALGAENNVKFSVYGSTKLAINKARKHGYQIVAIEQSDNSVSLHKFCPRSAVALLLGNEINGLSSAVLKQSDIILEIPMLGKKESLNVSVAAAIAMYSLRFGGGKVR